jgi:hypothetical protein
MNGDGEAMTAASTTVTVVNLGPAPIRFAAVDVAADIMQEEAWIPVDREIAPGQAATSTVMAAIGCEKSLLTATPATAEVVSADGTHRRVNATVDATAWLNQVKAVCRKL